MAGLASHRATTTVEVADRAELSPRTYFRLISDSLRDQGYITEELKEDPDVIEWLRCMTDELMLVAHAFPVGTVLERRGDVISVRRR